jgi:hypothetical protein
MDINDPRSARHLADETNSIFEADYDHSAVDYSEYVPLDDPRLVRIDRLRLLTDRGIPFYDISYCWGTIRDGRHVRVTLDDHQLPKPNYKGRLIELARAAGVNAKRLGLLDNISILRG